MLIKVSGIIKTPMNGYSEQQTKYYQPQQATKKNIKTDFDILLDQEIKKLKFSAIV